MIMPLQAVRAEQRSGGHRFDRRPEVRRQPHEADQESDPNVRRIVERVLRRKRATSPLASQILAAAQRLREGVEWDDDDIAAEVTRRICTLVSPQSRHNALTEGWLPDAGGGVLPMGALLAE